MSAQTRRGKEPAVRQLTVALEQSPPFFICPPAIIGLRPTVSSRVLSRAAALWSARGEFPATLAAGPLELGQIAMNMNGILDAARKVFLQRGFEGASIDEIDEAARSGKPTIYARFANKRALFTAVVDARRCFPYRAVQD
jgi:hypothetical protein